ncbi:MAG: phosphoglycerate dehydrogenase [Candidatus Omnitrophica bacterium CG08_land_8_20_14_0_20_41_16]|uniref:D-3-phosphoglycerate dehydrogenase n=1 Tax=Candidatus Sherwoodlollariibacterium unditelluris TaxID=1974757 RepID=A0A2G9YIC9_9BACT|nr:MAG: phosphoglycerate dehydrogenase [Candidatus Omnitrophica bacterium CG23_combo_of_CG06-09_8_20_14_all_41_10]PIS33962.1 MAG: phosphoglycerate dehydrogenase [Candidatus Omnitrophica bacterium CG08_land_8_20_14_0_20_41_16]
MKILVSDPLSDEGLKILKKVKEFQVDVKTDLKPGELREIIKDYDALLVRSATKVTKDIISAASRLKVIGRAGVGLDNVDLDAATQKGIIVMNTPGANTISTAEHTVSMILALSRNIPQASASAKKGEWKRSKFMGVELYSKVLGIIGFGRIGKEVAKRVLSFGMRVLTYDPFLSRDVAESLGVEVVELKDLFEQADYITVHTPMTDETKHMVSDKQFVLMKKGVRIINCARGGIVDEAALVNALKEGKVSGAALDVFEKEPIAPESELLRLDNVIVTPHLGASTEEAQVNVAIEVAEIVRDALLGKGIRNAANYPCLEAEVCKILDPYIALAERLGAFSGQLVEGRFQELDISYSGGIAAYDLSPLTMALSKGLLSPILKETVNFINAVSLAKERGIKIKEAKSSKENEFVNLIQLEIKTDKETRIIFGTLSGNKQPRIVKIDEYYVELAPLGNMIYIENWDRPGLIGILGTFLGKHNINIAAMTFGRDKPGGKAISVLNIDSPISIETVDKIKKLENILMVKGIRI